MSELNQSLVFSPAVAQGDTLCDTYTVVSGDNIEKIMRKQNLLPDKMLIARVNKMADPNRLSVGQKLKVVKGPFHAIVSKSQFRIDIYAGDVPSPTAPTMLPSSASMPEGVEPGWLYITSFPVGLGERSPDGKGGTPLGNFVVKAGSKLMNPHWTNPRTGEKFDANDPKNPIGERWLGLEGLDEKSKAFTGYGIHGTIDPASVGHEMSMGCVRMNSADVELVYELLTPRVSVVKIVP
jgi:lipoprotein-anchoring transpeptidase ErfK/SrfK